MKRTLWRLRAALVLSIALLSLATLVAPTAQASTPTRATGISYANNVFSLLNRERASYGLPAYRWNADLARAAHAHNSRMGRANTLSHQLPLEGSLGSRLTAVGYNWSACAENIAYGTGWTQTDAYNLHLMFYKETAPNDPHRRAILSKTYRDVGVDILFDATHHKMWITEDFGRTF